MDSIYMQMRVFKHKTYENYAIENPQYIEALETIKNLKIHSRTNIVQKTRIYKLKRDVFKKSKVIFEGVDLMVNYMDENTYGICCWKTDVREYLLKYKKVKSVFKIPVGKDFYGRLCMYANEDTVIPPINEKIIVSVYNPESSYVHEICHALIDRNVGNVENYLHSEFMPNLIQLLYCYLNHEDSMLKLTLQIILESLNNAYRHFGLTDSSIDRDKYSISALLAWDMFEKFVASDNGKQSEILCDIGDVLNGKLILESFLEKYENNFENDSVCNALTKIIERTM